MRRIISLILVIALAATLFPAVVMASTYERPDGASIVSSIKTLHPGKQHPRLMLTTQKVQDLRNQAGLPLGNGNPADIDPVVKAMIFRLTSSADWIVENRMIGKPLVYSSTGIQSESRRAMRDIPPVALMYALTKNQKYLDAVLVYANSAVEFPEWYPARFLDIGEMATAMSIVYDWCYDGLTSEQRENIKNALRDKALARYYTSTRAWNGNWNAVCNGGSAVAALAIADETNINGTGNMSAGGNGVPTSVNLPEFTLETALVSIEERLLPYFAPDGAWEESVVYWEYMMSYLVYMASSYETATGNGDLYGRLNAPGVADSAYFPIHMKLQENIATYGDAEMKQEALTYHMFLYLGKKFNNPDFLAFRYNNSTQISDAFGIIWHAPELYTTETTPAIYQDKLYKGTAQFAVMRGSDSAVVVTGGSDERGHGHHDAGNFIYDANGVRWALDFGQEVYYSDNDSTQNRYKYYRHRMEGHNTLVLNPSAQDSIYSPSTTELAMESGLNAAYTTADMSSSLRTWASNVKRGFLLDKKTNSLIVQDELRPQSDNMNTWWFMHTEATIDIKESGKAALLSRNGKYLYAKILDGPEGAVFTSRDATPLVDTGDKVGVDNPNEGVRKLSINMQLTDAKHHRISVALIPVADASVVPASPALAWIDSWNVESGYNVVSVSGGADALTDGDNLTKWSATGFNQIVLDLGQSKTIRKVSLLWGGKTGYEFNIHTSADGKQWGFPFRAGNSTLSSRYETYAAKPVNARYVRITVDGAATGGNCDIYEVVVE